jgi:DNA-directed RNA polymerase subunit RPC12/RpoP
MNYKLIYENLINRAKLRILEEYTESHHIIPKCIGGNDDESNLVDLTPEEHYLAHLLLVKIYPTESKLVYAANMMTVGTQYAKRNNKTFGWIRRKVIEAERGKIVSQETRKRMSESAKNKERVKCPYCDVIGLVGNMNRWHFENCKHHPTKTNIHSISSEKRKLISEGMLKLERKQSECRYCGKSGNACNITPHEKFCKLNPNRVKKEDTKIKCPHCNKEGAPCNMTRWHFDNCKMKPL